jgi:hypothetical protein
LADDGVTEEKKGEKKGSVKNTHHSKRREIKTEALLGTYFVITVTS